MRTSNQAGVNDTSSRVMTFVGAAVAWAALATSVAGCGIIKISSPGEAEKSRSRDFSYDGPECAERSRDDSDRSQVVSRICDPGWRSNATKTILNIGKRHQTFDDRVPSMLVAALQTIDCSRACERSPLALGMASYYAGILDETKLHAELSSIDVTEQGRDAFVTLAMASKADVDERVQGLDSRRRHMYVEVPGEVIAARRASFERHADLYRGLDEYAARARKVPASSAEAAEIERGLVTLREKYFERCESGEACRFDPFVYEVTRALVLLHVVMKDDIRAYAEEDIIRSPAAGRRRFGVEVGFAVYQAMQEERKAAEEYQRSKRAGMDAATLKARFGDPPPIPVDPDTDYMAPEVPPRLSSVAPGEGTFEIESGILRAKKDVANKPRGADEPLVELSFKDNVTKVDITSCYETNRVTGIRWDARNHARLEFETHCAIVGTKTNVEKIPSVLVPRSEAAKLEPGELVISAIAPGSRVGVVVRAETPVKDPAKGKAKTTPVVQVRGHRVHTRQGT
ncbi:hypothetical protein [Polyangium mundeleinium]|uniref:Lipoprotein n=1 Tax=Polyangium mundeleinium TaxID=2995306 RepID=A0ABT5ETG7_9BACT|nr:hypothetical protein [Polyangium mundeleinium]MDC0744644.1 hypothetical protein [Polyangium mundeleinium]